MRKILMLIGLTILAPANLPAQDSDTRSEIRELREKLERLERKLAADEAAREKKAVEERAEITETIKKDVISEISSKGQSYFSKLIEQTKVGAYGSTRFGTSNLDDLHNTFTFRRFVLTLDSPIAERLKANMELEFERFTSLELDKKLTRTSGGGLTSEVAIEGRANSEISMEQAWLQYDITDWLNFRGGAVLVPLGRFNINHDDNRWDLPRRSLVDRGTPVLPTTAAWPELGAGFLGDIPIGESGKLSYQTYVMNGVTLDSEVEQIGQTRAGDTTKLAYEIKLQPSRGTFSDDVKNGKAVGTRWAYSPGLGDEIAASVYWGRYTPDFLPNKPVFSFAIDGKKTWGPFEIEGQYVNTQWSGVRQVAMGLAQRAITSESEGEIGDIETEVEFELANLATRKQGYWLDFRYRFWPDFLTNTIFGKHFSNPQLIATFRTEQVWFSDLLNSAEFSNGVLTDYKTENRLLNRFTFGLTYRPVPLVAFQLAYEYTRTNQGKSLSSVTNYLPARSNEYYQNALLMGLTFGF
jgi:hypothetical protein